MVARESLEIIVPIYNEQSCIDELLKRLLALRARLSYLRVSFIFVDDGSRDRSLALLLAYAQQYPFVRVISFSRNFGHQMALTAAFDNSTADYVAVIDADLQDPPEKIEDMYKLAKKGYDVVYGQRKHRAKESIFKLATAKMYYGLLRKMTDVEIPPDTGDFRLMSRRVVDVLKRMRERHRFIRGMVPWSGFKTTPLLYERKGRHAGETKYPLRKMIRFAKDGLFSFSNIPLRAATYFGFFVLALGMLGALFMLYIKLFTTLAVPGITALIITVIIMSGIQIMMMGVMGEYVGRIFEEVKGRPLYVVKDRVNFTDDGKHEGRDDNS